MISVFLAAWPQQKSKLWGFRGYAKLLYFTCCANLHAFCVIFPISILKQRPRLMSLLILFKGDDKLHFLSKSRGSSVVSHSKGSLSTIWRILLWTSGGAATAWNGSLIWLGINMLGQAAWEQRLSSRYRGTDDGTAKEKKSFNPTLEASAVNICSTFVIAVWLLKNNKVKSIFAPS